MKKVTLSEFNISNVTATSDFDNNLLSKKDLIELVQSDEMRDVAIVGGDVIKWDSKSQKFAHTYDGWSSKRNGPTETYESYAERSRQEAVRYASSYPIVSDEISFLIVVTREITSGLLII